MLRNVQALVVLVLGLIPLCKSQHPSSELVAVWKRLSWKSVWLLDINSTGRLDAAPHWVKRASQEGISCTLLFHSDLPRLSHSDAVVVTSVREEVMDDVLALAAWRPHQVMVVDTGEWDSLPEHLEKVQLSTSFFYMRIARGQLLSSLWMLLTWKRQRILVKNEWKLDSTTNGYVPSYDMQGIELTSLTPPWPPWMTNFECQPDNSRCKTEGILTDLMEELQSQMNFTLRVDQNSVWGSVPKEGTFREGNAVFEGAMGAIVSNDYDVGLSAWGIRLDRSAYLDYSMTLPDHAVVAVNWDLLGTDLVMLLRPFTLESWIGIGVALVTVLLFLLVSRRTYGRIESSWQLAIGVDKDYYKVAEVSGKESVQKSVRSEHQVFFFHFRMALLPTRERLLQWGTDHVLQLEPSPALQHLAGGPGLVPRLADGDHVR